MCSEPLHSSESMQIHTHTHTHTQRNILAVHNLIWIRFGWTLFRRVHFFSFRSCSLIFGFGHFIFETSVSSAHFRIVRYVFGHSGDVSACQTCVWVCCVQQVHFYYCNSLVEFMCTFGDANWLRHRLTSSKRKSDIIVRRHHASHCMKSMWSKWIGKNGKSEEWWVDVEGKWKKEIFTPVANFIVRIESQNRIKTLICETRPLTALPCQRSLFSFE